jgi:hypothetical protein
LIKAYRQEKGVDIDGLVVSRPLCHDCVRVMPREKGGKIMISVIEDPDKTLPNPRDEAIKNKEAAKAKEVERTAKPPEIPDAVESEGRGRVRSSRDRSRGRAPITDRRLGGRGATTEKTGSLREGKVSEVANRRGGVAGLKRSPRMRPPHSTKDEARPSSPSLFPSQQSLSRISREASKGLLP